MASHVHMIIGTTGRVLDRTVGEMKSHTSTQLKKCIRDNPQESRKEWMIWIACPDREAFSGFERAGKKNGNNNDWHPDNYRGATA